MNIEKIISQASECVRAQEYHEAIKLLQNLKLTNNIHQFQINYLKAISYQNLSRVDDAEKFYKIVLNITPNHLPSLFNLSNIFISKNKINESIICLEKCLTIDKNSKVVKINLTSALIKNKNFERIFQILNEEIYDDHDLNINKLYAFFETRKHSQLLDLYKKVKKKYKKIDNIYLSKYFNILGMYFHYFAKNNIAIKYFQKSLELIDNSNVKTNLQSCEIFQDLILKKNKILTNNNKVNFNKKLLFKKIDNKINIGFISSDIRDHVVSYQIFDFLNFLLKNYSEKYNFYFFYNHNLEDKITKKIKKLATHWYNISNQTDDEVFNLIKSKNLNILFDLIGLSKNNRISLYSEKPSEILINWCGWLTSTNNKNFDYILGDNYVFENFDQSLYSEKPLSLRRFWSTISKSFIQNKPNSETNGAKEKSTIFLCPQRFNKIYDQNIILWKDIINRKTTGKFFLLNESYSDIKIREKLIKKFKNYGCDISKLEFFNFKDRYSYLELIKKADIALDTNPYSGMTTSFELMLMLIPTISLKGFHFVSNTTSSLNTNLDLTFCNASTDQEYINKAIELSENVSLYKELRKKLAKSVYEDDIFSAKLFCEDFVEIFDQKIT